MRDALIQLFLAATPFAGARLQPLAGDASFRRYARVFKDDATAMLMDAPPDKEDVRPFLRVARHLRESGYSAPAILAADEGQGLLLLEDIGDGSFTHMLKNPSSDGNEAPLYEAAIDLLTAWHDQDTGIANPERLPLPLYDEALLMREVQLFADWYLPQAVGKEAAQGLRDGYLDIWRAIVRGAGLATGQFVHRDYHADNLMWLAEREGHKRVGLLDFQDAVYGDAAYDLVSLLEDARRDVPGPLAAAMLERYIKRSGVNREAYLRAYAILGAQRNSKIIGIFCRLAARDGKHHYLACLPRVWRYLEQDAQHPELAALRQWLDAHVAKEQRGEIAIAHDAGDLALTA